MKSIDIINNVDLSLYSMQGQTHALNLLKSVVEQYHIDKPQIPSFLLIAQPGMGREAIARATGAAILGEYEFRHRYGQTLCVGEDINEFFQGHKENIVYYIEACEYLNPYAQNTIIKLLRNNMLYEVNYFEHSTTEIEFIRGLVFLSARATEALLSPLLDLIDVTVPLAPYDKTQLYRILQQRIQYLNWQVEPQAISSITISRETPGQCMKILKLAFQIMRGRSAEIITASDAQKAIGYIRGNKNGLSTGKKTDKV